MLIIKCTKPREDYCEASVLAEVAFLNTSEKCHLLLISSAFITAKQTEWILTMQRIISYKAQSLSYSTYCSPVNADSWASLKPPPNNLISLLIFLYASLCVLTVCGVANLAFFPSGSPTICHSILPTFGMPLLCNGINISQAAPRPFFLLTNWRWKESFQPAAEQ